MNIISRLFYVSKLDRMKLKCDSCHKTFSFKEMTPLQLRPCPKCECPNFIPKKISNYWLIQPLGAGGFGAVYKAISASNFGFSAIKILNTEESEDSKKHVESIKNEYQTGVILKGNPHLVKPIDFGKEDNTYYLVQEFIDGIRMDTILRELKQVPESIAYKLILQVLDIEEYIYKKGYLYRDLKPENIMIDRKGKMKLLDYGLCMTIQATEQSNLSRDTIEGSPHYLPPERIAGQREDQYSEIYSMGMLFYNMLSGHTFYKSSSSVRDLIVKHLKSMRVRNVKSGLSNCNTITGLIINRMIDKSPGERFASYAALRKALKTAMKKIQKRSRYHDQMSFQTFIGKYK